MAERHTAGLDFGAPVRVLDIDPDLAVGIPQRELEAASERAIARTLDIAPPTWDPAGIAAAADEHWPGLLVYEGVLIRSVRVGRRAACELFGPGDLIRPWDRDGEYGPLTITLEWVIPVPARVAVLDAAFGARVSPWPSVACHLIGRAAQRARALALTQAISHLPRVQGRLLLLFWLLAERWGTMSRDGARLGVPLTHQVLAMIVGAGRPTVTTALQQLRRSGLLLREPGGRWLLTSNGIAALSTPEGLEPVDAVDEAQPAA